MKMKSKPMTLQLQPSKMTCLITAFAMCLDVNVSDLMKAVGHNGTRVLFPELGDEFGQCGHSQQEIIDYCLRNGIKIVEIIPRPEVYHPNCLPRSYMSEEEINN